jgi:hypothetical protein
MLRARAGREEAVCASAGREEVAAGQLEQGVKATAFRLHHVGKRSR